MNGKKQEKPKVVTIGAGLGGLSCAVRLAHAGCNVTVLEKTDRIGGKLNLVEEGGFSWDSQPPVLAMPHLLRELWQGVDRKLEDYLTIEPLAPACRYHWRDGTVIDEDEKFWARKDVLAFLAYAGELHNILDDDFLRRPQEDRWRLLIQRILPNLRNLPKIASLKSMDTVVRGYFSDPHLVQIFNRFATFVGSSPYRTPSAFNIIPYLHARSGAWHVKGGMFQIVAALSKLAQEFGVQIRTNSEVTGFHMQSSGYQVALEGMWEKYDGVVCNMDALNAYEHLLPRDVGAGFRKASLGRNPLSSSAFLLFLGVKKKYECLAPHNVFFSDDYPREFHQLFTERQPADRPTISVTVINRCDPERAPEGCDSLLVQVGAPALRSRSSWRNISQAYGDRIIEQLEDFGFANLKNEIAVRRCFAPSNFRSRFRTYAGSLHGYASHGLLSPFKRPETSPSGWRGFAFTGSSVHHGGAIPMLILSSDIAANKMRRDLGLDYPKNPRAE